jgi:hypothetical protein
MSAQFVSRGFKGRRACAEIQNRFPAGSTRPDFPVLSGPNGGGTAASSIKGFSEKAVISEGNAVLALATNMSTTTQELKGPYGGVSDVNEV